MAKGDNVQCFELLFIWAVQQLNFSNEKLRSFLNLTHINKEFPYVMIDPAAFSYLKAKEGLY